MEKSAIKTISCLSKCWVMRKDEYNNEKETLKRSSKYAMDGVKKRKREFDLEKRKTNERS